MFGAISSSSAATFPVFHTSSYSLRAMALLFSIDIEETPYVSPTALLYHSLLSSHLNLTVRSLFYTARRYTTLAVVSLAKELISLDVLSGGHQESKIGQVFPM